MLVLNAGALFLHLMLVLDAGTRCWYLILVLDAGTRCRYSMLILNTGTILRYSMLIFDSVNHYSILVQSNSILTDLKGLKIFFSIIGGLPLVPIRKKIENSFIGQENCFHYRRNYVTSGSGIAGCDCITNNHESCFISPNRALSSA